MKIRSLMDFEVEVPGIGVFAPGAEGDVDAELAQGLIESGRFEAVEQVREKAAPRMPVVHEDPPERKKSERRSADQPE